MEDYFERVVEALTGAGYRWYETANFCRRGGARLRARHNLGYWLGRDYLGVGIGAVSTVGGRRWRNAPSLPRYLAALGAASARRASWRSSTPTSKRASALMLGLRLDRPLPLAGLDRALDRDALARLERLGLAAPARRRPLALTERGRFLGGGVTAELIA